MNRLCAYCGKPLLKRQKYCGADCYHRHTRQGHEEICIVCGREFVAAPSQERKFSTERKSVCSQECHETLRRKKYWVEITCVQCGVKKIVKKHYVDRGQYKFCSEVCWRENQRKGISESDLFLKCERCGKVYRAKPGQLLGTKHRSRYCSESCYRPSVMKTCECCGREFRVLPNAKDTRKFCSRRCYVASCETELERKVKTELDAYGEKYVFQAQMARYTVDFLLPGKKLIIEADGDYWHSLELVRKRDVRRDEYLRSLGFQVVRISESEFYSNPGIVAQCIGIAQ